MWALRLPRTVVAEARRAAETLRTAPGAVGEVGQGGEDDPKRGSPDKAKQLVRTP